MKQLLILGIFLGSALTASAQFAGTQAEYDALCARIGQEACAMIMWTPSAGNGTQSLPQTPCFSENTPGVANPAIRPVPPCPPGTSCNAQPDCQTLVRMGLMSDCGNTAANLNRNGQSGYSITREGLTPQNAPTRGFASPTTSARPAPAPSGFRMPGSSTQAAMDKEMKKQEKACNGGSATACACLTKNRQRKGYYVYSKNWLRGETCTPVAF